MSPSVPAKQTHLTHPEYRPDIDGLRAIAILSVVGFHAFPSLVKGGFVGVDIFFVISGFLISTIIIGSLERKSFSFIEFYIRRIRRIFPALLLVLIACLAFGYVALFADEYKHLGKHIAGGAGFISNFLLWNESGYFDNAADTKPLLHLWSLGIEEQFYIIWPLLLWFAWTRRLNLLAVAIVVGVASFILNINQVHDDHSAAFYSPQTRFWELMSGSILAYMSRHRQQLFGYKFKFVHRLDVWLNSKIGDGKEAYKEIIINFQSLIGVVLIALGFCVITKERQFPGWWAVLPILGAVLVISAGSQAWFNRAVLSNRVMVWFGLISFPLYLWHWPLLSFSRITEVDELSWQIRLLIISIAVVLAWITYWLIERPFRYGKHVKGKVVALCFLMAALGAAGLTTFIDRGFPSRNIGYQGAGYSEYEHAIYKMIRSLRADPDYKDKEWNHGGYEGKLWDARNDVVRIPYCHMNAEGQTFAEFSVTISRCTEISNTKSNIMIIGDSTASDIYGALTKAYPNANFLQATGAGCVPISSMQAGTRCGDLLEYTMNFIQQHKIDAVLLAGVWPDNFFDVARDIARLKEYGQKVLLVGPPLEFDSHVKTIILRNTDKKIEDGLNRHIVSGINKLNATMKKFSDENGIKYIDRLNLFCGDLNCPVVNNNAEPLILDNHHLMVPGMIWLGNKMRDNLILEYILH